MIQQVSSINTYSFAKDPRRKARTIQFKHNFSNSYAVNPDDSQQNYKSSRSPIWTGTSIILGSVLFLMIYFLATGSKKLKK